MCLMLPTHLLVEMPSAADESVINMFISTSSHSKELEQKAKNIKQTENLITLRDAILRVANYFFSADPNCMPTDPDLADELQVKEIL